LNVEKTTFLNDQFHEIPICDNYVQRYISKNVQKFKKRSRRLKVKVLTPHQCYKFPLLQSVDRYHQGWAVHNMIDFGECN